MKYRFLLSIVIGSVFLLAPLANSKEAKGPVPNAHEAMKALDANKEMVDVEEKIGEAIPLDIEFVDENNTRHHP